MGWIRIVWKLLRSMFFLNIKHWWKEAFIIYSLVVYSNPEHLKELMAHCDSGFKLFLHYMLDFAFNALLFNTLYTLSLLILLSVLFVYKIKKKVS